MLLPPPSPSAALEVSIFPQNPINRAIEISPPPLGSAVKKTSPEHNRDTLQPFVPKNAFLTTLGLETRSALLYTRTEKKCISSFLKLGKFVKPVQRSGEVEKFENFCRTVKMVVPGKDAQVENRLNSRRVPDRPTVCVCVYVAVSSNTHTRPPRHGEVKEGGPTAGVPSAAGLSSMTSLRSPHYSLAFLRLARHSRVSVRSRPSSASRPRNGDQPSIAPVFVNLVRASIPAAAGVIKCYLVKCFFFFFHFFGAAAYLMHLKCVFHIMSIFTIFSARCCCADATKEDTGRAGSPHRRRP